MPQNTIEDPPTGSRVLAFQYTEGQSNQLGIWFATWQQQQRQIFLQGLEDGVADVGLRFKLQNFLNEANRVSLGVPWSS